MSTGRTIGAGLHNVADAAVTAAKLCNGTVTLAKLGSDITAAGKALLDDAAASNQRATLELGAVAVEDVVPVAKGGTGASTAAAAREALGIYTSTLGANQNNSTTTPTEVTGLSKTLPAGTYQITLMIRYQAAATTTGVRLGLNFTGSTTSLVWNVRFVDVSATAATATPDQDNIQAAAGVLAAFAHRAAKTTANTGTTLGVDTANADMYAVIDANLVCTGSGDIELWHGSEVAAQSTIMAGTSLVAIKTDL